MKVAASPHTVFPHTSSRTDRAGEHFQGRDKTQRDKLNGESGQTALDSVQPVHSRQGSRNGQPLQFVGLGLGKNTPA